MNMVKSIAENVMQSLKTLLAILLNQVATQVSEQEVPQDQAVMMNELLTEVQSQKEKIEELGFMMKRATRQSKQSHPPSIKSKGRDWRGQPRQWISGARRR